MNKQDCFYLGKIVSKFSFKGEVLLKLDSDEIDFKKLKTIFLELDGAIIPYSIDNIKLHKSSLLRIRFENINNEENKKHSEPGKFTKDFAARKSDTSWASEINLD